MPLILTLILVAALLLIRLMMLRRELGRMTEQLRSYNEGDTGKKIDVALFDQKLEELAGQINRQSRLIVEAEAQKKRIQQEFRQAAVNMSHDIRTPLTSILGYIQLLEADTITAEDKREYVGIVKNRTKRLQALLNDFFELAVIESPDDYLRTEKIEMTDLISDILVDFYDSFNERGITPTIRLAEERVRIYADESAVRRVVENLLVNTAKYANGQVEICFERHGESVSLTIINEAKG
ncbi:Signal transduction histidine-protein kinase BarA [compost metagenome]